VPASPKPPGDRRGSTLAKLRDAKTLEDVARLLGFVPSGLSYVLYKIPEAQKYVCFDIPKRDGSKRRIKAPEPRLALLQRRLATLLYECLEELGNGAPPRRRSLAHGFEQGRSIITNANLHKRRRYVLNLDLEDFFPSINFGRIRGFFIKDRHFSLTPAVSTILAQIACHENELPQGSPCSPVISNLVGHLLDSRLARFAKIHKCTYSRYADDITFSTSQKDFPKELAFLVPGTAVWQLGIQLRTRIEHSGFKINEKKTRMQIRGSRQVVTGLMVNEKVNIRQEYWRRAREMCAELFRNDTYYRVIPGSLMGGAANAPPIRMEFDNPNSLAGTMSHIYQVKERAHVRERELKRTRPTAARTLYKKFLFFENFIVPQKPVIVPEGQTDSIYLRCVVRKLSSFHPRLGAVVDGKFQSNIHFMRYSPTVHEVLELGRGASQLKIFVERYHRYVARYGHCPLTQPVIVLIDNDEGGKTLFGAVKTKSKIEISFQTTHKFYYLGLNLYVIKTPEQVAAPHISCMESFFDASVLATVLEGKTFDPNKEHEEEGKYGKLIFATRVVQRNVDTIDFSGFVPLLDRIVAALDHHAESKAAPAVEAV
jgi:RNA-directed DNA polymerase